MRVEVVVPGPYARQLGHTWNRRGERLELPESTARRLLQARLVRLVRSSEARA